MDEMVTIPKKEYEELKKDSILLGALIGAGVDNWQGYDDALEMAADEMASNGK